MKSLISRIKAFALLLAVAAYGGVWATDYTYSNVDSDSLAVKSDGKFGTTTFSFQLNNPSANAATADFPASGYVQLTKISIGARSDNSYQTVTTATLTNNKTSESYAATVTYSSGNDFTAVKPDSWSRKEVKVTFGTDGVLVDTTATYTLTFTTTLGYSVVTTVASGTQTGDWKPAMRIYGRTPSGSMEMPSSLIPSSGGMALPSTVTVADATGMAFANDSVTIGNSGIQIALASALNTQTVMVKAVIPSSSSRLVGWKVSDSIEAYTSYTGSQFEQHFLNDGSVWGTTYGTSAWTRDANEHWLAVAYDRGSDTSTYLDGANKITNGSLKWANLQTSKVTIGGTAYNTTDAATGMVIKDVQIYNQSLGSERVAKVVAALNAGWTVNAAGTTLTSDANGSSLPGYENVTVVGTVTVAADGTLDLSGLTQVQVGSGATLDVSAASGLTQAVVTSGGVLTIGKQRPSTVVVMSGGTLNVSSVPTVSESISGYTATATLTTMNSSTFAGTVTLDGETATPVIEGGTVSLTGPVVAGNPSYTGDAWWWDYEFNGTVTSIGSDKGGMTQEGSGTSFYNNSELYFQKTPWRDASFSDKNELTAVMYCAPGNYANSVLVGFGSTTQGDQKAIALVTGANPAAGEMKLVLTDGHSGNAAGTVTELADLTAVGATTTKHLYAFVMDRITEDATEKTRVRVYLDGKVKAIYKHNGTLTLSNGFQIGSLHGGVYPRNDFNTGLSKYPASGDSGTLDFLRVTASTLTDDAMSALAEAYPYNSEFGKATRAPVSSAANWVATDVWTQTVPGQADATQDEPNLDTNVTISKDSASDVSVAINLTQDSYYESLTLAKEAGATGSLKLTSGYGNATSGKLVSAETSVLTDTTVPGGRVHLGVTSIADGITLTVDPFSASGNYTIYDTLTGLGFGEVYESVVISMALLGDGASVVLDSTGVATLAESGFTAELVYNPDNLSYTFMVTREEATADISVAIDGNGVASWSTRNVPVPAQTSLPDTYAGTVTITSASAESVEIATDFGGGSIAVSSGTVELSGDSTVVNVSGSGTLQVTGSLAVSGTFANTLTLAGDGTVTFATLPASALTFGTWTGTVVLPHLNSIAGDTFSFNSYGIEGSTVRVSGIDGGWLKNEEVNPTIDIPEGVTLTISDFSASFNNTFKALSGAGTFAVTYNTAIDTTSGSWYSNYSAYFLVKNVSNFTGSLSTATPGIAIGSAKPQYQTAGGKIYLASDVTLTVPSTSSIAPALAGAGRVVFEGALPSGSALLTSLQDSSNWTGTVELKNYTQTTEIDAHKIINLGNYGNSSSTVALNGVTSTMYTGNNTYPDVTLGAIEIGEGGWSDNDGLSYTVSPLYTANLTGHGTITVKTGNAGTVRFVGNHTFDGSVAFGANTDKQVAFMKTASDTLPSVAAKTIVVAGRTNMSIASGKTWTADAIKLDGSLTVFTDEAATATSSVTPTAYLDGATITTTVDGEAGTTTYVTDKVTQISDNQATLGAVTVNEPMRMTGSGGAYMSSLTINDGMTLTYDPVVTPLRVESAPVFNGTGKLKLAARYAGVTCGKFHLVSYPSAQSVSGTLHDLVDGTSFNNATYTVTEETVGSYKQLVLKVGDYDNDAKEMTIAQFGDSITEGIIRSGYRGTPNYRIPLMQLLEAYGYKPTARGYRSVGSTDANGVPADDEYKWHTGISAQRIYTGMTGTSLRAGFMESIEAHLEQVGVTDIITLKIGTNDSIGGETADNMFEGWTNLVWKVVRMRPTSKIVVCAPVKIRSGENNAPGLRTKIAEYMAKPAAEGGFPAGQVTMINGIEIVTDDANYYLTDNVHPNWNGHMQLANAWLPAVTNAFESMKVNNVIVHAAEAYTAQPAVDSAEDVDDLAAYRAGYVKLATFTNFTAKASAWVESPYSSVDATYTNVKMSRVAYFVARKTTASPDTRYVWVDMDADATTGTTLAQFGVPTSASVNGVVNNLHIYSNSSAIENVAPTVSGVKGTLMLTEKGVSMADGISTEQAPTGPYGFDWNDSIYAEGAWGVMNVARIFAGATPTNHRKLLAAQMLFDFNGFNGTRQNALGLGDFAVHGPYNTANGSVDNFNLNWTFTTAKDEMPTMDARALESGVIEIWGLVDAIPGDEGAAGYIDGTTAVITNTTSSVTVPAGATAVAVSFSAGDELTLTSESLNLATLGVTVYATDAFGAKTATDITAAFKVTAGANNTYKVELDDTATVGEVSVTPEVDTEAETAPMAITGTTPVFTVKTIPGLWYVVASGSDLDSLTNNGTPVQADESSETVTAPTFTGTVQYYKVMVGPSKDSVQ